MFNLILSSNWLSSNRPKSTINSFEKRILPKIDNSSALTPFWAHISWFIRKADFWQLYDSSALYISESKIKGHLLYPTYSPPTPKSFVLIPKVLVILCLKLDPKDGMTTFSQSSETLTNLAYFSMVGLISTVPNLNTLILCPVYLQRPRLNSDWPQHYIKNENSQIQNSQIILNL